MQSIQRASSPPIARTTIPEDDHDNDTPDTDNEHARIIPHRHRSSSSRRVVAHLEVDAEAALGTSTSSSSSSPDISASYFSSTSPLTNASLIASLRLGRRKSSVGLIEVAALGLHPLTDLDERDKALSLSSSSSTRHRTRSRRRSSLIPLPPPAAGGGDKEEEEESRMPNMWHINHIGLYCHSLAMGLVGGVLITASTMCSNVYNGPGM